jgi:putative ABC transport system permease protein
VAGLLPVKAGYDLGSVSLPGAKANGGYLPTLMAIGPPGMEGTVGYPLLVVDPEYVARFDDYGKQAAEALRAGKIVVQRPEMLTSGSVKVTSDDDYEGKKFFGHAAVAITGTPRTSALQQSSLISPAEARKLGTVRAYETQFELKREATDSELAAVAKVLGHDNLLTIEKGYQSPARLWFLGLLGAATVVTLLGVAISVSLSAAEGRADLATLAAVGAPPRRRRNLAAAQAWVLGQLGCVLGVGIGALYGYTAHAAFGSPRFMVPWQEIGGIVIVVPLFAGLLAWLLTRSRLPMVRRLD